jgi:hypothetical protein
VKDLNVIIEQNKNAGLKVIQQAKSEDEKKHLQLTFDEWEAEVTKNEKL